MNSRLCQSLTQAFLVVALSVGSSHAADKPAGLDRQGKPDLKSAGPLAFGPQGVLFVGDPKGAALYAIGIETRKVTGPRPGLVLEGLDGKLAGLLGTKPEDVLINDLAVQPGSGIAYLSVSRGKGPDAAPAIATVTPDGGLKLVSLDDVAYAQVSLANAPNPEEKDRRGNSLRLESITDMHYLEGRVFIAGLSNEEFASKLRAVEFPFTAADLGTSIEIYHGAHGAVETRSPVRTFIPFNLHGEPHLMAAYTCTPLVTIPVSQLKPGSKLRGKTVAELGNMNRPLDIITYEKEGHQYLLMANSARGVMKVATDNIDDQAGISERINGTAGLTYETISSLKGVEHLDKLGEGMALLLVRTEAKSLNLQCIELP
ncbi:MAG: hypothetical protein ACKV0T_28560 [Planctomycetales bacterium]